MIAFDTNFLILFLDPAPDDTTYGVENAAARVASLVQDLQQTKERILIPAPALAEFLTGVDPDQRPIYLEKIRSISRFEIGPFDGIAAVVLATIDDSERENGVTHSGEPGSRQRVKVDRQIVAIASARNARAVASAERGVRNIAERSGMKAIGLEELKTSPEQQDLALEPDHDTPVAGAAPSEEVNADPAGADPNATDAGVGDEPAPAPSEPADDDSPAGNASDQEPPQSVAGPEPDDESGGLDEPGVTEAPRGSSQGAAPD